MMTDTEGADLKEMQQESFCWLLMPQVWQDKRVGLDKGDQLLLLLEDLLEILVVVLWVFLLLKLFDDFDFRDFNKSL